MKILFHSVFGTKYTIQSVWDYTCHEFLIWLFFIMSFFEPFGLRTLAYSWTISGAWITFMMSSMLPGKEKMKNKRSSKWFGLCKSKMVLSNYMHSLAWTGYLQKIGCEPITISSRFHKLGIKGMLILHALCTNSGGIVTARAQNSVMLAKSRFESHSVARMDNQNDFLINLENIGAFDKFSTKQANKFLSTRIEFTHCFMAEKVPVSTTVKSVLGTILANQNIGELQHEGFSFLPKQVQFAVDNCATHNVCNDKKLFLGEIKTLKNLAINGVGGTSVPLGMGTVAFTIKNSDGVEEYIKLPNTIYMPQCPKNLISIARWSKDRQDNCGIFSRGTYSIFLWNDDKCKKLMHNDPNCPIPLMSVNEGEGDEFEAFLASNPNSDEFTAFFAGGPRRESPTMSVDNRTNDFSDVAQQTTKDKLLLPAGHLVRHYDKNKMQLCEVTSNDETIDQIPASKIRPLNSSDEIVVPNSEITSLSVPEPSDVPDSADNVNVNHMPEVIDKIRKLWNLDYSDFTEDEKLFYYWHKRLRHAPKKHIRRLAKRGALPKRLQFVKRMPICAACAFADAAKRRSYKSDHKSIRKQDDYPGSGTSCDHIISHEPGLIPQVTGRLTHARYAGSIIFSDHYSDYTYVHMITSTSTEETMIAKRAYERVAKEHGVSLVRHYRADNLRFNDIQFQEDCKKNGQTFSYCGVGAHHQNGLAEAKNKTLSYGARKLLLHA